MESECTKFSYHGLWKAYTCLCFRTSTKIRESSTRLIYLEKNKVFKMTCEKAPSHTGCFYHTITHLQGFYLEGIFRPSCRTLLISPFRSEERRVGTDFNYYT